VERQKKITLEKEGKKASENRSITIRKNATAPIRFLKEEGISN